MIVIKRDGSRVVFNGLKIKNAVLKAFQDCKYDDQAKSIIDTIYPEIESYLQAHGEEHSVEEIQDTVEQYLMKYGYYHVARAYIKYRYDRQLIRESKAKLMEGIAEKLHASSIENQNANVDEASFGGRIGEASRLVMKDYALNYCMSEMARNNHLRNEIYIHDLDSYAVGMHNCLSVPFDDLLAKGFNTRQTGVRPANSINTAFQLVAVIFQLQSLQQFGGVSATHLDWTMVPYVRKSFYKHFCDYAHFVKNQFVSQYSENETYQDYTFHPEKYSLKEVEEFLDAEAYKYAYNLTQRELYQAVEGMYHNLNTLQSRSGNQLPFTSINYGTCTLPEGRMVTKALLEGSIKGVGKHHRTPIFPCGIFQKMKGVNDKGSPNYDLYKLALKSTSQRLYPNYANVDWSGNAGYDPNDPRTYFSTMGK